MRGVGLLTSEIEAIREEYLRGLPVDEIARAYNISRSKVHKVCFDLKQPPKRQMSATERNELLSKW